MSLEKYLFLENVDRLLKSPANQRGRDFAVMLQSLNELGYAVEWRVINAAEYGMPQRRRRVFFLGYHKSSDLYKKIKKSTPTNWISKAGIIASAFPVQEITAMLNSVELENDLVKITNEFNKDGKLSPFHNTGLMINGKVYTTKTLPLFHGEKTVLNDVLIKEKVSDEFYIVDKDLKKSKIVNKKDGEQMHISTEKKNVGIFKRS